MEITEYTAQQVFESEENLKTRGYKDDERERDYH